MAKIAPAIALIYRSGVAQFSARAATAAVRFALGEVPENDLSIEGGDGLSILTTDTIVIVIDGANYGPFNISTLTRSMAGFGVTTQLSLTGCGSVLRDIPIVDDDLFEAVDNISAFAKISGYVAKESGSVFPVTFVNAETVFMGSSFTVRSSNALDAFRSLAGATGNALRVTPGCSIEVGKFGADSGLLITNTVTETRNSVVACVLGNYHYDASDVYGWLFVEGGSFLKKVDPLDPDEEGKTVNLALGSRYITTFKVDPPDGFAITEMEAGTRLHYKLIKTGSTVKRGKRIQIAAISPRKEHDLDSEVAAAELLAISAALYLSAKSSPETAIEVSCNGVVPIAVGEKARVYIACLNGDVVNGEFYAVSVDISVSGGSTTTSITLSSRLTDPEDLLKAGATVKSGATGRKEKQLVGSSQGTTIGVSPASSVSTCGGSSKQVYVQYAYAAFDATPANSIEADQGITMTVSYSSAVDATLCFYKTSAWTGLEIVKVILAGPRNV